MEHNMKELIVSCDHMLSSEKWRKWERLQDVNSNLLQEYVSFKKNRPQDILFFQVGEFYELYEYDAEFATDFLGLKLTKREIQGLVIPMCGMPKHSGLDYAYRLANEGYTVTIVAQEKDEEENVTRKIGQIITPGTITDNYYEKENNPYIMTAYELKKDVGVVLFDTITGETKSFLTNRFGFFDFVERYKPQEIRLYLPFLWDQELLQKTKRWDGFQLFQVPRFYDEMKEAIRVHKENYFTNEFESYAVIAAHFFLIQYMHDINYTHVTVLPVHHIQERDYLALHEQAVRGLDLLENSTTKKKQSSLFHLLDYAQSAKGSRLLKSWIQEPLLHPAAIQKRLNIVAYFSNRTSFCQSLRSTLEGVPDVERILARIESFRFHDDDFVLLQKGLEQIHSFLQTLEESGEDDSLRKLATPYFQSTKTILDDLQSKIDEEHIIAPGFNPAFDTIKEQKEQGLSHLESYYEEQKETHGLKGLKLKDNKVLGYFFELTLKQSKEAPEHFDQKEKLSNAVRYHTTELKEKEISYLQALESYEESYRKTLRLLISDILSFQTEMKKILDFVSLFDVLLGFATLAKERNYVKPRLVENKVLQIKDGKHPLLDAFHYKKTIANSVNGTEKSVTLVTGPNMGGKSSYLKMIGLMQIMAQIGCFVPASAMNFSPVDRILLRMGANDNLLEAQSTFKVEMDEMAYILYHTTENSLILMDELGRGTSTSDGIALARSIIEDIHENKQALTFCSTHYHELVDLENHLTRFHNVHAEAKTNDDQNIKLTYRILRGGSQKSFGIEVAKHSGIPENIIQRATQLLQEQEKKDR